MSQSITPEAVRKLIRRLNDDIEAMQDAGVTPTTMVLSLTSYQGLMAYLAGEEGRDYIEARTEWHDCQLVAVAGEGIAEVTGDVQDIWEAPEAFLIAHGMAPLVSMLPETESTALPDDNFDF